MKDKKTKSTKFSKGFFTSIKSFKINHSEDSQENEKPFEWSENVLNGKTKVKLIRSK